MPAGTRRQPHPLALAFTTGRNFFSPIRSPALFFDELRDGGWRKLIYRRWKIIYTIRNEILIVGRVWPAALGEADLVTPLD